MRAAAAVGSVLNVTCYIGFCTLRCTKMESKKKKPALVKYKGVVELRGVDS